MNSEFTNRAGGESGAKAGPPAAPARRQGSTRPLRARSPYRWYAAPAGVAAGLWLLAAGGHLWWGHLLTATAGLVAAAVIAFVWITTGGPLRRRIVVTAAAVTIPAWLTLSVTTGPWTRPALLTLAIATVAATVLWSRHPRIRARVQKDADVQAWPLTAVRLGIEGAVLYHIETTKAGRKMLIELAAGQTWRSIQPETADSVLGVAPGATSIERDHGSARHITLHVQRADPWSIGVNNHPMIAALDDLQTRGTDQNTDTATTDPGGKSADSAHAATIAAWSPGAGDIRRPIPIGDRPDGITASIPLWEADRGANHALIGGETGAGKSVLYRDLITGIGRCDNAVIYGIDTRKRGKAFGPCRPLMTKVATSLPEAVALLETGLAIVQASAERSAKQAEQGEGTDNVEPTPQHPHVSILIDEASDIFDYLSDDLTGDDAELKMRCVHLAEQIGAAGRSEAVSLILATQRPDPASLGNSATLRSHFGINICLRLRQQEDIRWVLPGIEAEELDPSLFRYPGLFFLQLGADTSPTAIRAWNIPTADHFRRIADILTPGMTHLPTWLTTTETSDTATTDTEGDTVNPFTPNTNTNAETAGPDSDARPFASVDTGATEQDHKTARQALADTWANVNAAAEAAETDLTSDVPDIPLTDLVAEHDATVVEPGDHDARAALIAALEDTHDDGATRDDLVTETGLDPITVQRLLGVLERAGDIESDNSGEHTRWRTTTPEVTDFLTALEAMPTDDESDGDDTTGSEEQK